MDKGLVLDFLQRFKDGKVSKDDHKVVDSLIAYISDDLIDEASDEVGDEVGVDEGVEETALGPTDEELAEGADAWVDPDAEVDYEPMGEEFNPSVLSDANLKIIGGYVQRR